MSGALKKTMMYLGLAEDVRHYDDEYEEYYDDEVDDIEPLLGEMDEEPHHAPVTPISRGQVTRMVPRGVSNELHRISTVHPRSYNEAKDIGESFRAGTPVIMNLTEMSDSDAKRLVDFAAGLVFGLHGSIERVTAKVFLLSPANVEVTAPEPSDHRSGVFNQT